MFSDTTTTQHCNAYVFFNMCLQLVMANFETNMSWAKIEVLGVEKGNGTTLTRIHNTSDIETDPVSNM